MKACNTTLEDEYISEIPLWENGLTWHHLGLIISAVFGLISVVIALFLIFRHATHYSKPNEQKHIIRVILMIPIYSTVSYLSFLNYRHAIYYQVLRDCYEAFAIASFFTLLCNYIAPNLHEQKEFFRTLKPINWFWGVFGLQYCTGGKNKGPLRIPRSGLTWFNVIWVSVFQYCFIEVTCTIISVITQALDRYCEDSINPVFAHVWILVIEAASVTVAMFCLIQFYLQLRGDLAEHRPFLKVLCIKLVIFFSFWQSLVISFLSSSSGPLQATAKLGTPDIRIGISSTLLCIEMTIFSIMHVFAFPWKPYRIPKSSDSAGTSNDFPTDNTLDTNGFKPAPLRYRGGPLGLYALADAFNPWDIVKASARGFRWLFVGRRTRETDPSYTGQYNSRNSTMDIGAKGLAPTPSSRSRDDMAMSRTQTPGKGLPGSRESDTAGLLAQHDINGAPGRTSIANETSSPYLDQRGSYPPVGGNSIDLQSPPHYPTRNNEYAALGVESPTQNRFGEQQQPSAHAGRVGMPTAADYGGYDNHAYSGTQQGRVKQDIGVAYGGDEWRGNANSDGSGGNGYSARY